MRRTETLPKSEPEKAAVRPGEIVLRIASALVLAAVALGATLYSPWTFLVLVMVGGGLAVWEWGRLTRGNGFDGTALISAVAVGAAAVLISLRQPNLAALILTAVSVAIFVTQPTRSESAWSLAGLLYVALPAAALVWLRGDPALGAIAVVYLFVVAWTTDTASYAAGRLIGGPKLAPRISPRKTWSGFIIGALTPALVGIAFAFALKSTSALWLALVSVALALACQAGDLTESWVKRRFGAKDMSRMIPGHGGLLDRIDGVLFAAVVAALIAVRDLANPGRGLLIW
ncbi:MAG TPA: phosphatidate cytidylyltransferase [Methyloceanibacter sp.]|nr:phosphatidate cytidylyltransferase [Methyloceanibacter sp.]